MMRGSRDSEDWSNDAENTALMTEINNIWQGIHIGNSYFELLKIFHNCTDFTVFVFKEMQPWWAEET